MEAAWTKNELECFLLIYVSHVDIDFSDEEKNRIKSVFGEEVYSKMYTLFDGMSDYKALETILAHKTLYFNDDHSKQALLDSIKIQFFVDGEYTIMEKELHHFLERML